MRKNTSALTAGVMALSALCTGGHALAQEEAGSLAVEEIIVTARKIQESLNDAPVAVSAFTDAAMEELDINSVEDIARFTPGLSFSKAFGRATERPVVRGQGNILAGVQFGVESGVAYFVDGMYYAGDIQSLDMSNVERVEVIRGPQSALYGRNTYSGAINFVTRSVGAETEARVRVRGLEDGEYEVVGSLGGQLIDDVLSARVALRSYSFDGQWTNLVTGKTVGSEETNSVNLSVEWNPSDALAIRLRGQYQQDDDGTRAFFLQPATENNCYPGYRSLAYWPLVENNNPNQFFCGEIKARPIMLNDGPDADGVPNVLPGIGPDSIFSNLAGLPFLPPIGELYSLDPGVVFSGVDRELAVFGAAASYDMESGHALSVQTSFREEERASGSDSDHGPTNFFFSAAATESFFGNTSVSDYSESAVEVRLDSPADSRLRWTLGAFYYDYEQDQSDLIPGGTNDDGTDNFITNVAGFGSLALDISEQLTATAELRYADEKKDQQDLNADGQLEFGGSTSFTSLAPRLTVDYRMNEGTLVYGIYSEGIKPGGLNGANGLSVGSPAYQEEESQNVELGVKTSLMDGRVQLNASLFFSDISQYQLTTPVANPQGVLNSIVTNQADGQVLGAEIDLVTQLTETIRAGVTYALADSEFTSGCDEFQWTLTSGGGKFQGAAAGSLNPSGMGDCSVKGHQFPMGSKHQASGYIDWSMPMASLGLEIFANVNVTYESKRYTQLHFSSYAGDATLFGGRAGVRGDNWHLAVVGRNLSDEDSIILATRWLQSPFITAVSRNVAPATADRGMPRAFFAAPRRERQIGLEFNYRM